MCETERMSLKFSVFRLSTRFMRVMVSLGQARGRIQGAGQAKFPETPFELSLRRGGCCICGGGEISFRSMI
jgi:hypothetical protein